MALGKYRVNGTINAENMVQRVQTWIPNPVVGDLYYEYVYTNYRDVGGVMMPRFHQHQDYDDGGTLAESERRRPRLRSRDRLGASS